MNIEKLKGKDKLLHSRYGNLIFIVVFLLSFIFLPFLSSLLVSIVVLFSIGLVKELYDKYYKKTFADWYDIVASFTPYIIIKNINK